MKKKNNNTASLSGTFRTVKRMKKYLLRYAPSLSLSVISSVITSLLALSVPVLVGRAVNCAVGKDDVDFARIGKLLILIAAACAGYALIHWIGGILNNRAAFGIVRDIRRDAAGKITRLPLSYLDSHPHGELLSRITTDADIISDGLLLAFTNFTTALVTIIGALVMMFVFNPVIAAIVVLLTPVSVFAAGKIAFSISSSFRRSSEERGELTAVTEQYVAGHTAVTAFSNEDAVCGEFDERNFALAKTQKKATFLSSLVNPSTRLINNIIYSIIAAGGAFAVIAGSMDVGTLTAFLAYSVQYTKPLNEISGIVAELQNALACAERLFDLLDAEDETDAENDDVPSPADEHEIAFENASFSYLPEKPLIRGLDLRVRAGEHVAIVGPTGCGKTTLINLLMRFYDLTDGTLSIDRTDVTGLPRSSVRRLFGMVLQDTWLARDTVAANIAYGKPDASRDEIIKAAKAVRAHGFITRLPNGYDTVVGGDDDSLSNGQKQLLCIARVMLYDPPMLILDEATSSVDTATEHKIQAAFDELCRGRTSFIVAHRLSTVRSCDRILVMRGGDIVESGTHEELLALGGFYHELYYSRTV